MQEIGYSFSLTTFSPTGQLWQIQYALQATNRGRASIGVCGRDGVVLVCQRKQDEASEVLIDQSTVRLMENIAPHIGITYSGLQADFRPILSLAREIAVKYKATYGEGIPVKMLAKRLAQEYQENTHQGGVRPFGCSVLLAGFDYTEDQQKVHVLYQIDPSGSFFKLKAWANGKNNEQTRQAIEKRIGADLKNPALDDAIVAAIGLLRENMDVELGAGDIVVGVADKDFQFKVLSKELVEQYFKNVE